MAVKLDIYMFLESEYENAKGDNLCVFSGKLNVLLCDHDVDVCV
jgi:hypothetical protein